MPADKLNEDKFDEVLRRALRGHSEPVPADFTDRMLRQIKEAQQQRILARVVLQERVALASCIASGIIAIAAAVAFPSIVDSLTGQVETFIDKITQTIEAVSYEWQFYMVFAAVFGFTVYSLVDLFAGDS